MTDLMRVHRTLCSPFVAEELYRKALGGGRADLSTVQRYLAPSPAERPEWPLQLPGPRPCWPQFRAVSLAWKVSSWMDGCSPLR
jgi:hypothetical protein